MDTWPEKTLDQFVARKLEEKLAGTDRGNTVVWWDDGGYLRDVLRRASDECGDVEFVCIEENPIAARRQGRESRTRNGAPQVWYFPQSAPRSAEDPPRNWFRDIQAQNREVYAAIEAVVAEMYGSASRFDLFTRLENNEDRQKRAEYLLDELNDPSGQPSLSELRAELLTGGHGEPVEYLLEKEWNDLDRNDSTVRAIRAHLSDAGIRGLNDDDSPDDIVRKVRKWVVGHELLSVAYSRQVSTESVAGRWKDESGRRQLTAKLADVLRSKPNAGETYLGEVSVLDGFIDGLAGEQLEEMAHCPVGRDLEHRLWKHWHEMFDGDEHDRCRAIAGTRFETLCNAYEVPADSVRPDDPAWIRAWRQAEMLAELATSLESWSEGLEREPVAIWYADAEEGAWTIDRAVRRLVVSGEPETELPTDHPAADFLAGIRSELVDSEYLDYLDDLADETAASFDSGEMLETSDEVRPAYHFWRENRDALQEGDATALFFVDALRADLAHELADHLRGDELQVDQSIWRGMLPSETKFGMSAPLPVKMRSYDVRMHNGKLQPRTNGRTIDKKSYRKEILEREGWRSTDDLSDDVWGDRHVAYFDTTLDKFGEGEFGDVEELLATQVSKLAEQIREVMLDRGRERVFVVTDHGFVLLPSDDAIEALSPSDDAADVHRRRVASSKLEDTYGVRLGGDGHSLAYLQPGTEIDLLVDPRHRFKKQGLSDNAFYHGGGMPQECILTFLEVEKV